MPTNHTRTCQIYFAPLPYQPHHTASTPCHQINSTSAHSHIINHTATTPATLPYQTHHTASTPCHQINSTSTHSHTPPHSHTINHTAATLPYQPHFIHQHRFSSCISHFQFILVRPRTLMHLTLTNSFTRLDIIDKKYMN